MKRVWIIVAAALAVAAVILFIRQDYDKAFISAALGAVAWFLSYRAQLRAIVKENDQAEELEHESQTDEDESS